MGIFSRPKEDPMAAQIRAEAEAQFATERFSQWYADEDLPPADEATRFRFLTELTEATYFLVAMDPLPKPPFGRWTAAEVLAAKLRKGPTLQTLMSRSRGTKYIPVFSSDAALAPWLRTQGGRGVIVTFDNLVGLAEDMGAGLSFDPYSTTYQLEPDEVQALDRARSAVHTFHEPAIAPSRIEATVERDADEAIAFQLKIGRDLVADKDELNRQAAAQSNPAHPVSVSDFITNMEQFEAERHDSLDASPRDQYQREFTALVNAWGNPGAAGDAVRAVDVPDFDLDQPVPDAVMAEYGPQVPPVMRAFWQRYGFGRFCEGYLRAVDPRDWLTLLPELTSAQDGAVPLFLTAWGELLVWDRQALVCYRPFRGSFTVLSVGMDTFFSGLYADDRAFLENRLQWQPYLDARAQLGEPAFDQCFGYQLLLALGGFEQLDRVELVQAREYILLNLALVGPLF